MVDTVAPEKPKLTPEQEAAREEMKSKFADAVGVGYIEGARTYLPSWLGGLTEQDIIQSRTTEQVLNGFEAANPAMKPVLDAMREDPALAKAMHNALAKDHTMLDGFSEMMTESGASPEEMATTLKNPMMRGILTQVFDKIGESDDDDINFDDFRELYKDRNNLMKSKKKLEEMGIDPTSAAFQNMDWQQALQMLFQFFQDPRGALNNLAGMLHTGNPEQDKAIDQAVGVAGTFAEVAIGGKDGYGALFNKYGPSAFNAGADYYYRVSGDADADNKAGTPGKNRAHFGEPDPAAEIAAPGSATARGAVSASGSTVKTDVDMNGAWQRYSPTNPPGLLTPQTPQNDFVPGRGPVVAAQP
ncbi:MAG: hypothetical protein DI551_04240 [Micavibrio aeruginosavorus]|uniref:Uncharacterized protein n=1 Tax=Micavibrio aeruginosavorus TaxID=349221 RepID=A0A2W5N826_9BACT|nr:MAG: hypothetical protein DI551_04240 [Micavibrio aeruginosavorus]